MDAVGHRWRSGGRWVGRSLLAVPRFCWQIGMGMNVTTYTALCVLFISIRHALPASLTKEVFVSVCVCVCVICDDSKPAISTINRANFTQFDAFGPEY